MRDLYKNRPSAGMIRKKKRLKFSFCELDIEGNGIKAKIESFIIPELNDFSFKKIKQKIPKKLFLRKNVLIIGGSNGLGEIAVKILCALDANVTFTYNNNYHNQNVASCRSIIFTVSVYYFSMSIYQILRWY